MPTQAVNILDAVDVGDLFEIEIIFGAFFEDEWFVDGHGANVRMVDKLSAAEQEGSELVVVETPNTVGAGGLEVVGGL